MRALALLLLLACKTEPPAPPPPAADAPRVRFTPSLTVHERVTPTSPVPAGAMRHVVVVIVDTLREDALRRARTPTLDGLAATGAQRTWAWAPSTWTAPSVVSLFTGMPVRRHGWDFPFPKEMDAAKQSYPPLPATPLLAEVLAEAGFQNTGLYGNRMLGQGLGFGRGFHRWEWGEDQDLVTRAVQEVGRWGPEERHFLYLHLMGPHHPLSPGERSRKNWGIARQDLGRDGALGIPEVREGGPVEETLYFRAYHAAVEDTDERLGLLLRALRPHLAQTALVITSDHGELLGEHGALGHEAGLWEPLTRVPFVGWNLPPLPALLPGEALADLVTDAVGVTHPWPVQAGGGGPLVSQREGALALTPDGVQKGMWDPDVSATPVAFDLVADPGEERPLALPLALEEARRSWEEATPAGVLTAAEGEMDPKMRQALEELGYLDR